VLLVPPKIIVMDKLAFAANTFSCLLNRFIVAECCCFSVNRRCKEIPKIQKLCCEMLQFGAISAFN